MDRELRCEAPLFIFHNIDERNDTMTVLEATVEIAKATLIPATGVAYYNLLIKEEKRKNLLEGITQIYKALEGLTPKPKGRQL